MITGVYQVNFSHSGILYGSLCQIHVVEHAGRTPGLCIGKQTGQGSCSIGGGSSTTGKTSNLPQQAPPNPMSRIIRSQRKWVHPRIPLKGAFQKAPCCIQTLHTGDEDRTSYSSKISYRSMSICVTRIRSSSSTSSFTD